MYGRHQLLNQVLCCDIKQRVLNTIIDNWLVKQTPQPELPSIVGEYPVIAEPCVDVTKRFLGFGRSGLKVVKKMLKHKDVVEVMRALATLVEVLHQPEKTFEALRLGFVEALVTLMLHPMPFIREHVCMAYYTLADQLLGCQMITRRYCVLENLAKLIDDEVLAIRHKAQKTVEMIVRHHIGAYALNDTGFALLVLKLIRKSSPYNTETLLLQLLTLKMLLLDSADIRNSALASNAMDQLVDKINKETKKEEICVCLIQCVTALCWEPLGKAQADAKFTLVTMYGKLLDKRKRVHTAAAGAITFMTHTIKGKNIGIDLNLIPILLELSGDFHCAELQLNAIKALTNLSENWEGRCALRSKDNQARIKAIVPTCETALRHIGILDTVIHWEP